MPQPAAKQMVVDATGFDDILSGTDTDVQTALQSLDSDTTRILQASATYVEPDQIQSVKADWMLFSVEADQFPNGITITDVFIKLSANAAYTIVVKHFADPQDGSPTTVATVTTGAGEDEKDSGGITVNVAAGRIVKVTLPATDVPEVHVSVHFKRQ